MNFFENQERSKKKSVQLIAMFILAVTGIILAVYAVIFFIIYQYSGKGHTSYPGIGNDIFKWIDPQLLLLVGFATLCIILGGSIVKIIALRRGGQYIAESLGGRPVNSSTKDPNEKKFVNVVEEMAIASGVPVPVAYVLEGETGINAFAAGYSPNDAVVAVTNGCLQRLSRDELQGVVAHEFSHILNGDMRLNIRLIGLLSGIMIITTIGSIVLRSSPRSRKGSPPLMLAGLALIIIGYIGVFISRMIQSAVSRQREYLADASSVQFTRNPSGIANALKKIGGFSRGSILKTSLASEASHMFFSSAIKTLFATHPPLVERIRRIEPSFSGNFAEFQKIKAEFKPKKAATMGFSGPGEQIAINADNIAGQMGMVLPEHVQFSTTLLGSIPPEVRKEMSDPLGASAVVLALLLNEDKVEKKHQIKNLEQIAAGEIIRHTLLIDKVISGLDSNLKLPLLDLALPTLRQMSPAQFAQFKQAITSLVESDGKLSLFEFSLQQIIASRLEASYHPAAKKQIYKSIEPLIDDAANLIAKLAFVGHADKTVAQKAYDAAMKRIPVSAAGSKPAVISDISFDKVGRAISHFAASKPGVKQVIIDACAHCVLFDRTVSTAEAELLRAIAFSLDLPLAPFLTDTDSVSY